MKRLEDIISDIQTEIDLNIEYINCGGCGWFAYYMAQGLSKLGVVVEIALINDNGVDVQLNKGKLNDYRNGRVNFIDDLDDTSFAHCYLKLNKLCFDAIYTSVEDLKNYYINFQFEGTYTLEELETALEVGTWNDTYDVDNNKLLQEIIENNLMNRTYEIT